MKDPGHIVEATTEMDAQLCRMAVTADAAGVIAIVRDYLSAWPAERVARLQRLDAGWAPFNEQQEPLPVHRPADVCNIQDAVREQCLALRDAGVAMTPELLELDQFFHLARIRLSELQPDASSASDARERGRPGRRHYPQHT